MNAFSDPALFMAGIKYIYQLRFLLPVLFLFACSDRQPEYFPLTDGTKWQYLIKIQDGDTISLQKYLLANRGKRPIEGQEYFVQQTLTGSEILYKISARGIEQSGFVSYNKGAQHIVWQNELILPGDIDPDSDWEGTGFIRLPESIAVADGQRPGVKVSLTYHIAAVSETVRTARDVYSNCLRVDVEGFEFYSSGQTRGRVALSYTKRKWYAKGIGLVKSVEEITVSGAHNASAITTMELERVENS